MTVEDMSEQLSVNKQRVQDFYDAFYNAKDYDRSRPLLTEGFVNHHPGVPAGRDGTLDSFRHQVGDPMPAFSVTIKRIAAEGDLVWVQCDTFGDGGRPLGTMVDIWRVAEGLLAELWDYSGPTPADA